MLSVCRSALFCPNIGARDAWQAVVPTNKPSKEFQQVLTALNETIENRLFPLVRSMDKRIALDIAARDKLRKLSQEVEALKRASEDG